MISSLYLWPHLFWTFPRDGIKAICELFKSLPCVAWASTLSFFFFLTAKYLLHEYTICSFLFIKLMGIWVVSKFHCMKNIATYVQRQVLRHAYFCSLTCVFRSRSAGLCGNPNCSQLRISGYYHVALLKLGLSHWWKPKVNNSSWVFVAGITVLPCMGSGQSF